MDDTERQGDAWEEYAPRFSPLVSPSVKVPKGDRRRLARGSGHPNSGDADSLSRATDSLFDLHNYYNVFERFTKTTRYRHHAAVKKLATTLDGEFDELDETIGDFIRQLQEKQRSITLKMRDAFVDFAKQENWWEATNIFHHGKT